MVPEATSSTASAACSGGVADVAGSAASASSTPASTEEVPDSGPLTKVGSCANRPYRPPAAAVISVTVTA